MNTINKITHYFYDRTTNLEQNFEKLNLHKSKNIYYLVISMLHYLPNFQYIEKPETKFEKMWYLRNLKS